MVRLHAALAVPALLLTTLSQAAPEPKAEPLYYPTTVGTTWVYQVPKKADQIIIITDVTVRPDGVTAVTTGIKRPSDSKMFPYGRVGVSRSEVTFLYPDYTKTPGGELVPVELSSPVVKLPHTPGETWVMPEANPGGDRTSVTSGPVEVIDAPAGRYKCDRHEIVSENGKRVVVSWNAPGVGLVKLLTKGRPDEAMLLKSFTPGNGTVPPAAN